MRKQLLLLPLISLLVACQKETIDSKRICALVAAGVIPMSEGSMRLGLHEEELSPIDFFTVSGAKDRVSSFRKYCEYFEN